MLPRSGKSRSKMRSLSTPVVWGKVGRSSKVAKYSAQSQRRWRPNGESHGWKAPEMSYCAAFHHRQTHIVTNGNLQDCQYLHPDY